MLWPILVCWLAIGAFGQNPYTYNSLSNDLFEPLKCPEHWLTFQDACFRFIRSPLRSYLDARKICQAYGADLATVNNLEEHGFLIHQLTVQDPQHNKWYVAYQRRSSGSWVSPVDDSQLSNMESAFLPTKNRYQFDLDYLVYSFSEELFKWGFEQVNGSEPLPYICEAAVNKLQYLVTDERSYLYGIEIDNPEEIPRGPYFTKQPADQTFDLLRRETPFDVVYDANDVALSCLAGGYPTPTYEWFKGDYENDRLIAVQIDPLKDFRVTVSGGTLIISNPSQSRDRGTYHCKATNKFGTIISEEARLNFGHILEFNLKRSNEKGDQNWGKAVYCDPPSHYPEVKYYWARDYFPNFVEEDKRVFVSSDGALYFSALETIDRGNYSCAVQSKVSDTGRNGPFFSLFVNPHSDYQTLKFSNNFPKAFPEAPVAGESVRLECVAFGYPVPDYNWTRVGAPLPKSAQFSSYNRVMLIPRVQVEDQGVYVCRAYNDRISINNTVVLNIQAEPNFTIPLVDKHVDNEGDLTWTCEAFGIPDVTYSWWKNGKQLIPGYLEPEDRDRFMIQDNVLTIRRADPVRDPGMYQCQAQNQLRTRFSSAQLRVLSLKPTFKKNPMESETYAAEYGNVTIKCNPEAAPRPKFVWKKDNNVIGSGGHRRILENGNLIISPVSRDDGGFYACTASNAYGVDESRGRLIVLHAPKLVQALRPQVVVPVGRSFGMHCEAATEQMLDVAYVWKHNGIKIRDLDVYNSKGRINLDEGHIFIENTTFADAGEYECIIKSTVGSITSRSLVIVEGPPGMPGGVQIGIERKTVTLQWTDGATHGQPIIGYMISARTNWNQTWINLTESVHAEEIDRYTGRKEAKIENILIPWSIYEFRVAARNELGLGEFSDPSPQHSTGPAKPSKAPDNVGGGGGKIGDLTITWDPLKSEEQHASGIHYKIFYRLHGKENEFQTDVLKSYGNIGKFVVQVSPNLYYTKYDVKVQAINEIGKGPESDAVVIYSAEDMPQVAPQQVTVMSYNSTALNVTWLPVDQSREMIRGRLIGHRLKYWKDFADERLSTYYLSRSTKPWALIVGLQPDTYYFVKVMAYNAAGEGPESERMLERTFRKAPQKPPSAVHVKPVDPSTIRVTWRYVASSDEEPLIGYKVRVWESDQDMSTANDTLVSLDGNLEAFVRKLTPGKMYNLRVLAYSNGGDGRMSSPTFRFQMGNPEAYRSGAVAACTPLSTLAFLYIPALVYGRSLLRRARF